MYYIYLFKIEAEKKEKEQQKKLLKKERKSLRTIVKVLYVKSINYD